MTMYRTCFVLLVLLVALSLVDSFAPITKTSKCRSFSTTTRRYESNNNEGSTIISFRYSPASLLHIENVDLPPDYSRPWTKDKTIAMAGALALGGVSGLVGELAVHQWLDIEKASLLFGAVGAAAGWYLLGGGGIAESEKAINGGLDAKLIADKPKRLKTTLDYLEKTTTSGGGGRVMQQSKVHSEKDVLPYVLQVHDKQYVEELKQKSQSSEYPSRLYPTYSRTLIDQHSYPAAIQAVGDWIESVDRATSTTAAAAAPVFLLVRPPSHHACKSQGKGGCLLNSIAIAAVYALQEKPNVQNVAILDVDAHHGNGIAHCVQDEPRIRYCSIHQGATTQHPLFVNDKENENDPRGPSTDDVGPLGNILNVNLSPDTTWESGYADALQHKALPFLCKDNPDLLLVAAGFDAMEDDWSSRLALQTRDYAKLGAVLQAEFGNRVAFGLEGGYAYENGNLAQAISEFVKPWQQ